MQPRKRQPYGQWSPDVRALEVIGGKWTLLIVRDLLPGPLRFVELQRRLPGISTEQLRIRLVELVAAGLLERHRFNEVPPRVEYSLTPRARDLAPVIAAIAEWGVRWTWGPPREGERVDVAAVLRGLTAGVPHWVDGARQLELRIGRERYTWELGRDGSRLREGPAEAPDATISGSHESWVRALSPAGGGRRGRGGLRIAGDRRLAEPLIDRARDASPS